MSIAYPRDAAQRLHIQLSEQRKAFFAMLVGSEAELEPMRQYKERVEPIPSLTDLESLLDTAFFASLTQEEAQPVSFTLLYCDPNMAIESKWPVIRFSTELPLAVEHIRKLSPAADPITIDICVFHLDGELKIWGMAFIRRTEIGKGSYPPGLSITSRQVGVVIVREGIDVVLTFSHGQIVFNDPNHGLDKIGLRQIVARAFDEDRSFTDRYSSAAKIIDMACVALEGGAGATVLVVPKNKTAKALDQPKYGVHESSRETLATALADDEQIPLVRSVARLAFIDGALVLDESGMLIGAGAMIRTEETPDFKVSIFNPSKLSDPAKSATLSTFSGGARHRSALVFCYLNPGAIALVVSHDGVMSLLLRPIKEDRVFAIRPFRRGISLSL